MLRCAATTFHERRYGGVSDLRLAYTSDGPVDAPALVLGNSLGTTTAMWEPQLESLSRHFRVVRWDLPGHGRSPRPDHPLTVASIGAAVVAMLDQLDLPRVSYCGVSIGGMVGISVASRDPGRVHRLALCCTSAHLGAERAWLDRAATVRASGMSAVATPVISRWFTDRFCNEMPDVVEALTASFRSIDAEGYALCCEALAFLDLRPALALIESPTLVVTAADDHATPPDHGAAIAAAVAGSRLVCVEHAAHLATVERADRITPLLLEHLVP